MENTETFQPDAATEPTTAARQWFRYCLNNGVRVWASYGQTEIEGWVLKVTRHTVEIQDAECGHIQTIALVAVNETVEA